MDILFNTVCVLYHMGLENLSACWPLSLESKHLTVRDFALVTL